MNATIATMAVVSMANVEIQLEAIPVYVILGMKVMAEFAEVYMMAYSNKQIHRTFQFFIYRAVLLFQIISLHFSPFPNEIA